MTTSRWLQALGAAAVAAVVVTGCGGSIHEPWLSGGEAEMLGDELNRAPETDEALDHRLTNRVAGYRGY